VSLDYPRYIEVNLSKQRLWAWQDKHVIYESPITSGATGAGLGTVTGLFSIYYKTTNTHLRGQGYDVPVKWWMPFYKGYGLHDASWRHGQFGGSDYYYAGSHGCVNLPDATAEFIYGWAEIGTPVWVHK
jgi:lipoprotein-anchoring transpeptidase ErfK/SrfK